MSDFLELFTPKSDPKHLTPEAFIAKEAVTIKNAIVRLPDSVQQFVDTSLTSVGNLASAAASIEGTALAGEVANFAPQAERLFLSLLGGVLGVKTVGEIQAAASSPAGQTAIQQITSSAAALIQHLGSSASAGIVTFTGDLLPTAAAVQPPAN